MQEINLNSLENTIKYLDEFLKKRNEIVERCVERCIEEIENLYSDFFCEKMGDEKMSKRYKEKNIKHPFCVKIENAEIEAQYNKVVEEFMELGMENANVLNKLRKSAIKRMPENNITRTDIEKAFMEAFDVSQAAQGYMWILANKYGKHFGFTFNNLFDKAIEKNADRGYYGKDFNMADWREKCEGRNCKK